MRSSRGVTAIELATVIAILAILSALAVRERWDQLGDWDADAVDRRLAELAGRDLKALAPRYRLTALRAYDTLPHTPHLELVAWLEAT